MKLSQKTRFQLIGIYMQAYVYPTIVILLQILSLIGFCYALFCYAVGHIGLKTFILKTLWEGLCVIIFSIKDTNDLKREFVKLHFEKELLLKENINDVVGNELAEWYINQYDRKMQKIKFALKPLSVQLKSIIYGKNT